MGLKAGHSALSVGVLIFSLCVPGARLAFADAARSVPGKGTTLSGQDALEKLVLKEEEALTNQLQSADSKARALGDSGNGFGTYMLILAGVVAGVVVLRKVLPILAFPFISDDESSRPAPVVESPHAHEEAFSEYLEKFNSQQKPVSEASGFGSLRKAEEEVKQLKLPLDSSTVAQGKLLERVQAVRSLFLELSRAGDDGGRNTGLEKLAGAVGALRKELRVSEGHPTGQMVAGIEALMSQFSGKAESRTPAALRTLAGAIDLLPALCDPGIRVELGKTRPIQIMAADDDAVIRQALGAALKRVGALTDFAKDGEEGFKFAEAKPYDLIFVDIEMPGIDGFELCCRIKNTPLNPMTPVVFVTSHNDLATRAKSSLAGGLEFVGKPFVSSEIGVKALTLVLKRRLQSESKVVPARTGISRTSDGKAAVRATKPASRELLETAAVAS